MLSPDSGVGSNEAFYTPSQTRQRPLVRGSSSKRSLFRDEKTRPIDSDDENDMAGMSPLTFSDENSSAPMSPEILSEKSSFSSLRKLTQDARNSPRKVLYPLQPQNTPPRPMDTTEIVPETPQSRDSTPMKSDSPVVKLVTPLRSVKKNPSSVPKLSHRRKIFNEEMNDVSPVAEIKSTKRCLSDSEKDETSSAKIRKIEEPTSVPKARTSLFQEKRLELNTKSFYGSSKSTSSSSSHRNSFSGFTSSYKVQTKSRRSTSNIKGTKKATNAINFGVKHGIKPKIKKPGIKQEKMKQIKQEVEKSTATNDSIVVNKTNKFLKIKPDAKITINDKIKLNVFDKKIVLCKKESKVPKKKPALDISFDAADLSVEEPAIEQQKGELNQLLQSLRDDWDDDEEEPSTSSVSNVSTSAFELSSAKETSTDVSNSLMSPESELSNMTQDMNIEDGCGTANTEKEETKAENGEPKVYPIFMKNFSANHAFESETKKKKNGKRFWQSSAMSNQYQLDAGQKNFGATQCKDCGIIYDASDPDDENAHLNYHNSFRTLSFSGWKNERVIYEEFGDRIILVEPGDPKTHWNKVNEVLRVVDMDLGLAEVNLAEYQDKRIYMYVRDKTILGVVVAEHKEAAYRMIPDLLEFDCCTKETTPVKCGINVVWTAMKYRKTGIATKLVNALRSNYYYGYIMNLDDIAFSMPTPSGKIFAEKYTKSRDFKVYY